LPDVPSDNIPFIVSVAPPVWFVGEPPNRDTVAVETIITLSPDPGITPPTQVLAEFQSPPAAVLEMVAAEELFTARTRIEKRKNFRKRKMKPLFSVLALSGFPGGDQ
jgi:hypothetical protein